MKKFLHNNKKKISIILIALVVVIICVYIAITVYSITILSDYDDKIYPNVYIDNYDISNTSKKEIPSLVEKISNEVKNSSIILTINKKEYEYTFKDLGISINSELLLNDLLNYDKKMSYSEKLNKIISDDKKIFAYDYIYSKETLKKFLEDLKLKVDTKSTKGKLVMDDNRELSYKKGTDSFELNVEENIKLIENKLYDLLKNNNVELVGITKESEFDNLSTINTKVSSFSTTFNEKVSRGRNIENAARYLDGVILNPGDIFSFFKYTGPYGKAGYVYYDNVMGNGVCQVASTMYNTELLAGLKTIERYSHEKQMSYVKGGLDATVASVGNYSKVDLKFKNTYEYPIYISAYTNGNKLTIDFWSNDKAKNGRTYELESVKIGYKGYKTYRKTYENGKEIRKDFIATTWYPK